MNEFKIVITSIITKGIENNASSCDKLGNLYEDSSDDIREYMNSLLVRCYATLALHTSNPDICLDIPKYFNFEGYFERVSNEVLINICKRLVYSVSTNNPPMKACVTSRDATCAPIVCSAFGEVYDEYGVLLGYNQTSPEVSICNGYIQHVLFSLEDLRRFD